MDHCHSLFVIIKRSNPFSVCSYIFRKFPSFILIVLIHQMQWGRRQHQQYKPVWWMYGLVLSFHIKIIRFCSSLFNLLFLHFISFFFAFYFQFVFRFFSQITHFIPRIVPELISLALTMGLCMLFNLYSFYNFLLFFRSFYFRLVFVSVVPFSIHFIRWFLLFSFRFNVFLAGGALLIKL